MPNVAIIRNFDIGSLRGYSARLSIEALKQIRSMPEVDYIEVDQIVTASFECVTQSNAVWGLNRIAEVKPVFSGNYVYSSSSGNGVDAYIIDTGIQITQINFDGHAIWGANFADDNDTDCAGHGTHVAGTIGSQTYGIAKNVTLIAVKVLGCDGSGTTAGVIQGVNWAASTYQSRKKPAVSNMSLGGAKSATLAQAVKNAISLGLQFAIAAGNDDSDACTGSPSNVVEAVVVGATTYNTNGDDDYYDVRAYFSNYGTCLDVFAPGQAILSTWIGPSNNETKSISGTSMAAPHACGVMALYLGEYPDASPSELESWLADKADSGILDLVCAAYETVCQKSPNKILYSPCPIEKSNKSFLSQYWWVIAIAVGVLFVVVVIMIVVVVVMKRKGNQYQPLLTKY
eukprot:TRINITY_DN319_c0_g1_i12.p1 TRINITY_DN319_c0_g1~~TRINITY_DN319_c0_g1_i12.p1  ORF type:complete len:400 (-),score=22.96 TRINITY_DN319_c0_g1_i12:40-1239(-)